MSEYYQQLNERFCKVLADKFTFSSKVAMNELTITIEKTQLLDFCQYIKEAEYFAFDQLIDVCAVDYVEYAGSFSYPERFAVVYHLLSVKYNQRVRLQVFVNEDEPRIHSVISIWPSANWFEREAFDLFGIIFDGHPDLRRILTDYGFIGHPFRKDFPLIGQVEMRYDDEKQRVVYEPVSIEARVNIPRVIRDYNRYRHDE